MDLFPQPHDENFNHLRIVLVHMFPNAFAQLGAREGAPGLTSATSAPAAKG